LVGYYEPGKTEKSNRQAQVDMIDESLKWAGVTEVGRMVDVGCGLGGSSRYIARKFGASACGVTLSPFQAQRASEITREEEGVEASFQVADALDMPFEDSSFDLCWSMESGEHMPDKRSPTNQPLMKSPSPSSSPPL
jgi:tocopherol O-methyltransferase